MRSASPLALALLLLAATGCREIPEEPRSRVSTLPNADPDVVAAQPTALPSEASIALPPRFTALGTEPFWAATVVGDRLTYSTPLDQPGRAIAVTRTSGPGFASVEGVFDARPLRLRVTKGPCSDGMSDTVYPFSVVRTVTGAVERGCARPD